MIQWKVYINAIEESSCVYLTHGERLQIKETDNLMFVVNIDGEEFSTHGIPTVVIGDIPLNMVLQENFSQNYYTFISNEPIDSHSSRYFYNFFGESEISCSFENTISNAISINFDILARKENALIANEMLGYLVENLDDAVAICFSRSKKSAELLGDEGYNFNKIDAIKQAFYFLSISIHRFVKEKKSSIDLAVNFSADGNPTGPDSVYWALTHLDQLLPANQYSANIYFNNRGYHYEQLPKETSFENFDLYENRVINSFLINAEQFLLFIKDKYSKENNFNPNLLNTDYVRFDHTMSKFSKLVLEIKIKEIEHLITKARELQGQYFKLLPSKIKSFIIPRMTSYVVKHSHYKESFFLIDKYYRAQAPDFSNNKLLLGLKNLSIIYEITSLLLLCKEIEEVFDTTLNIQNFRVHAESYPFGGIDAERPKGIMNNHFVFSGSKFNIDLLYEAKIYPYSANNKTGDLIDTSNTKKSTIYGKHYCCPDFVLRVSSKEKEETFTIILDAKFKDINTIKQYDIDSLTNKYLLNIHSVDNRGKINMSSINVLIILFAHTKYGSLLRTTAPRHCLTGQYPIFPQSTAIALQPNDTSLLKEHLIGLKKIMSN